MSNLRTQIYTNLAIHNKELATDAILSAVIEALPERETLVAVPEIVDSYKEKYGDMWPYVLGIT